MSKPSQKKQTANRRRGNAVRRKINVRRNNTVKPKDQEPSSQPAPLRPPPQPASPLGER